jgi:hypothetical protein
MHKTQDEKDEPLGEGEDGAAKKEANKASEAIYQVPRVINILLMCLLHSELYVKNNYGNASMETGITAIYDPMIYKSPCLMVLVWADPLRGQVGGGWTLEIETFLGDMKWHRAVRRVPFGAQKSRRCH